MGKGEAQLGKAVKGAGVSTQELEGTLHAPPPEWKQEKKEALKQQKNVAKDILKMQVQAGTYAMRKERKSTMVAMQQQEKRRVKTLRLACEDRWRFSMRSLVATDLQQVAAGKPQFFIHELAHLDRLAGLKAGGADGVADLQLTSQQSTRGRMELLERMNTYHMAMWRNKYFEMESRIRDEFTAEGRIIQRKGRHAKQPMVQAKAMLQEEDLSSKEFDKNEHMSALDGLHNSNLEQLNNMRLRFDAVIDDFERRFDVQHEDYLSTNEERTRDFQLLMDRDVRLSSEIESRMKQISRLKGMLQEYRKKIAEDRRASAGINTDIAREHNVARVHYLSLKAKLGRQARVSKRRLIAMGTESRTALTSVKHAYDVAVRIMKMAEHTRRSEFEMERVPSTEENGDIEGHFAHHNSSNPMSLYNKVLEPKTMKSREVESDSSGDEEGEHNPDKPEGEEPVKMTNFNRKLHRLFLSHAQMKRYRNDLAAENRRLRRAVTMFLEGVQVTKRLAEEPNSLIIVNGETNAIITQKRMGDDRANVIEGCVVARRYAAISS